MALGEEAPPPPEAALARRMEDFDRRLRELGPSIAASFQTTVADLQAQQATLTAQQAALAAAVANISTLVSEQIKIETSTANSGGAITVAGGATYTPTSVTVPSGYTRAYALGTTCVTFTGPSFPLINLASTINGNDGYTLSMLSNSSPIFESGATSHAVTLLSLTAGSSITLSAKVVGTGGGASAYFINTLAVFFLR